MSQYNLEPLASRYEVTIGWDPPLGSFFLQVCDGEIDDTREDPVVVWMGADWPATESDVDRILDEAFRWAVVPDTLRERLLCDRSTEGTRLSPQFLRWFSRNDRPVT